MFDNFCVLIFEDWVFHTKSFMKIANNKWNHHFIDCKHGLELKRVNKVQKWIEMNNIVLLNHITRQSAKLVNENFDFCEHKKTKKSIRIGNKSRGTI